MTLVNLVLTILILIDIFLRYFSKKYFIFFS